MASSTELCPKRTGSIIGRVLQRKHIKDREVAGEISPGDLFFFHISSCFATADFKQLPVGNKTLEPRVLSDKPLTKQKVLTCKINAEISGPSNARKFNPFFIFLEHRLVQVMPRHGHGVQNKKQERTVSMGKRNTNIAFQTLGSGAERHPLFSMKKREGYSQYQTASPFQD